MNSRNSEHVIVRVASADLQLPRRKSMENSISLESEKPFSYEKFYNAIDVNEIKRREEERIREENERKLKEKAIEGESLVPKRVNKRSVTQMVNDLSHLRKIDDGNVLFRIGQNELHLHSVILLVRSTWFRRSWRMGTDLSQITTSLKEKYNFEYNTQNFDLITDSDFAIKLIEKPKIPSGEFLFDIELASEFEKKFLSAFRQFKAFLYSGTCEINQQNSHFLTVLSDAFETETLKTFLSDYYTRILNPDNINDLIRTVDLAETYKLSVLKGTCIKLINENAKLVANSSAWSKLSKRHPNLVLEIFRKK